MGLLVNGHPLSWAEAREFLDYVREHGVEQLLHVYDRMKHHETCECQMFWGDEVEYMVLHVDKETKHVTLNLRGSDILRELEEDEQQAIEAGHDALSSFKPEYGRYMIEGTPFRPFSSNLKFLCQLEQSMVERRKEIERHLDASTEMVATISSFFHMGVGNFTTPPYPAHPSKNPHSRSFFVPDEVINPHPRFGTLTENIRRRRGEKVCILVPVFRDRDTYPDPDVYPSCPPCLGHKKTTDGNVCTMDEAIAPPSPSSMFLSHYFPEHASITRKIHMAASRWIGSIDDMESLPYVEGGSPSKGRPPSEESEIPSSLGPSVGARGGLLGLCKLHPAIHMDCMAFGMGCCCLQCTFQTRNMAEARNLYDQLAVLCPIMLAVTAATPIFKGYLADIDARWHVVSASVDDRGQDERSSEDSSLYIPKSRYDSISLYIAKDGYNDIPHLIHEPVYEKLRSHGLDDLLSRHFAHLFTRDPLVIYRERIELDDRSETDHFENIQSTNWQTVRFKPPPPHSDIGWRVEFRVMEVQFSDFENAAFIAFMVLMTRVILKHNLNMYIPLSKVDANMARGHQRDAINRSVFWFRSDISKDSEDGWREMSVDEILNGSDSFGGLIPLIRQYIIDLDLDPVTHDKLTRYVDLVSGRASGEVFTTAKYIREYVRNHPAYTMDSFVPQEIVYDLIMHADDITKGNVHPRELFGSS